MMGRIYRRALIALVVFAGLSAFYDWRKIPAGVLVSGVLALANLRGLVWGVTGALGTAKATKKLVLFSALRLVILLTILLSLLKLGLINPFGVLAGLTVVFTVLVIEGFREALRQKNSGIDGGDSDIISPE